MSDQAAPGPGGHQPRAFLREVHRFRGVAIVGVILGHLVPRVAWHEAWSVCVLGAVVRNATWWFVFIAGLLFQQGAARFEAGPFLRQRAVRLLVPYACWSLLVFSWAALDVRELPTWTEQRVQGLAGPGQLLWYLGTGAHLRAFWYVPVALLLALGSPLWLRLARSRHFAAALVAAVVLSLLVPRMAMPDEHWPVARRLAHFLSPYLLGMATALRWEQVMGFARRHVGWLLAAGGLAVALQVQGVPGRGGWGYLAKVAWTLPLLVLLARYNQSRGVALRGLDWLATHSFALYFAHYPLALILRGEFFTSPQPSPSGWLLALGGVVGTLWLSRELEALTGRGIAVAQRERARGRPVSQDV